jgi:hypothetical protein
MKINYNKNPLFTTIDLNETEKKELWYKIKIAEMEELLFSAAFALKEGQYFDLEEARRSVDMDYYCTDEKSPLDERCDILLEHFLGELQSRHVGDCTCVACSCSKCHAESFLDINTMKGLGKHSANKIDGAFGKDNEKTIDEAIASLANYEINPDNFKDPAWEKLGGYEQYIPRWKAEAVAAHDWLVKYKNEHFSN